MTLPPQNGVKNTPGREEFRKDYVLKRRLPLPAPPATHAGNLSIRKRSSSAGRKGHTSEHAQSSSPENLCSKRVGRKKKI